MGPESFEVPNTLVSELEDIFIPAVMNGERLYYSTIINAIEATLTRDYNPGSVYPSDTRSVVLKSGVFEYIHGVVIQKHGGREVCNLSYQLLLSDYLVADIRGVGNNPKLKILKECSNYPSPYIIFSGFGFLQRPVTIDNRRRR